MTSEPTRDVEYVAVVTHGHSERAIFDERGRVRVYSDSRRSYGWAVLQPVEWDPAHNDGTGAQE